MTRAPMLIAWSVWLEFFRRKDFYVMTILLFIYLLGIMVMKFIGVESRAQVEFLTSLGIGVSAALAAVLTAVFAGRQLPEEIENRTLYPLLARPVSRAQVISGKFLGVVSISVLSFLIFVGISLVALPSLEASKGMLFQVLALRSISLLALAALALALSARMPAVLAASVSLVLWFGGRLLTNLIQNQIGDRVGSTAEKIAGHILFFVPDFSAFDFSQRYVNAMPPLPGGEFVGLAAYGIGLMIAFYGLAFLMFHRRAI